MVAKLIGGGPFLPWLLWEEVWGNLNTLILCWFGLGVFHMNFMSIGGASETAVIAFAWDLLGARAKGKCWQESGLILLA